MTLRNDILRAEVLSELENDILPFWLNKMQDPAGGFRGRIDGTGRLDAEAPKGAILNARILWTFSSAYRLLGKEEYLGAARNAFVQIRDRFYDPEFGGIYWSLSPDGKPLDTKKQFYAIAFAVYGCAEYFRAAGEEDALELAIRLWRSIEDHSRDTVKGGYLEACTRDWQPIEDMRLSEKDRNDAKTMNTHLHILEGYTGLYRVWKDETLRRRLVELCHIFTDRIVRPDGHLGLFFDEDWNSQSDMVSYGHDIEASWLLCETAELLGDDALLAKVRACCARIAAASLEGLQADGSMIYEYDPKTAGQAGCDGVAARHDAVAARHDAVMPGSTGHLDTNRHWWVQAETVVGCLNQGWEERALRCWDYIKKNLLAPGGEWYWSVDADGTPNTTDDRAGFWKCPYHNGRMCMEIIS